MDRVLLVDGTNVLMRAKKAMEHAPLQHGGVPTGPILVFINMLTRHIREEKPDRVVIGWDSDYSWYRQSVYPMYKGGRTVRATTEHDSLIFDQAKTFLTLAGLFHVELPGWEADDVVAIYWRQICAERIADDVQVTILSGDKDLHQLVRPFCTQVEVSGKPPTVRWDVQRVFDIKGCPPEHFGSYLALVGDSTDNVTGVPGLGPKKALQALEKANWDIEAVFASLDPDRADQGRKSHAVVDLLGIDYPRLGAYVSYPPTWTPVKPGTPEATPLLDFLDGLGLTSVTSRFLSDTLW